MTKRTAVDIRIHLLEGVSENELHIGVLGTLQTAIKKAAKRVEAAEALEFEELSVPLIDLECEFIESLLGTAYVVCQTQITAVTAAVLEVRKAALAGSEAFGAFANGAAEIRQVGPRFNSAYSKIEVLWALANYFKHRDEWPGDVWIKPKGQAKKTVPVLIAAGLVRSSSGNLRRGATALGNSTFMDTDVFEKIIGEWAAELRERVRQETGR